MRIIKAARGRLTGRFGDRNVPGASVASHRGIDIGHGDSTPDDLRIVAPAAGKVVTVGKLGTYGRRIVLDHGNNRVSLIAHLASASVSVGDTVTQGDTLGVMGNSGTTFVHAHQEFWIDGVPVDPELYLSTAAGGTGTPITTQNGAETMGLVVKIKDGDPRGGGDIFYVDRKTIVHLGTVEDAAVAARMSGREQALQTAAEFDTIVSVLGIPASQIKQGVKYFG